MCQAGIMAATITGDAGAGSNVAGTAILGLVAVLLFDALKDDASIALIYCHAPS